MATGFCFGRAENLENYFNFTQMASDEFDPNLYFKNVSCLLWLKLSSEFAVMSAQGKQYKLYVNRSSSFGMKRWRGMHDGEIKTKSSVCLLLHRHTWGYHSQHTLQLVISVLLQGHSMVFWTKI